MLLGTIVISILLPYQVHPTNSDKWQVTTQHIVAATIDTARIVGLPRLRALDKKVQRIFYINELNLELKYQFKTRRQLIHNYFSE